MTIVATTAFRRWSALLQIEGTFTDGYGDKALALAEAQATAQLQGTGQM